MKKIILFSILYFFPIFAFASADIPEIQDRSVWDSVEVEEHYYYKPKPIKKLDIPQSYIEDYKKDNYRVPEYSKVERIIVHDTGCCNGVYSDKNALIQRINKDHSIVRGWGDIGYNYLIDKSGTIYEGRDGGNGKRGAHAYDNKSCRNFNVGTIGIALIGDYEHKNASKETLDSLYKLIGWLSATNSINPQEVKTSPVWSNPRFRGECITKYGGSFSKSFTGPTILGHKDVEASNTDPGVIDMDYLRLKSRQWKDKYENYTYKTGSDFFTIKDGKKIQASPKTTAVKIAKSQADLFLYKDAKIIEKVAKKAEIKQESKKVTTQTNKLSDGTLIKSGYKPYVFVIENGQKRHITSYKAFIEKGYSFNQVKIVDEAEIAKYLLGAPIFESTNNSQATNFKNEILIKKDNSPQIYLVKKNEARWIKTYNVFKELGYSIQNVLSLSDKDFSKYLIGAAIASVSDVKNTSTTTTTEKTAKKVEATKQEQRNIRIALAEIQKDEEVKIRANGEFDLVNRDGNKKRYNKGQILNLVWNQKNNVSLRPINSDTIFEILTYTDYNWDNSVNFNKFRGKLDLAYSEESKKVWLVNSLPLEQYLLGMAEAENSDPEEYQKAFSIASRSYALFHLQRGGKRGLKEIFDLNNTPSDQVYRGYKWESYAPNLPKAMQATEGQVMKYNGKIARAVYSSDSGGVTKNACKFWRGVFCTEDYKYLSGGVKDPAGTVRRDAVQIAKSHGVGMSAVGGRRLAEMGKSYEEILKYYYKGITIDKL